MMRNCALLSLALLAAINSANGSSHLRPMLGPESDQPDRVPGQKATIEAKTIQQGTQIGGVRRFLQGGTVLNGLINTFLPAVAEQLEGEIAQGLEPASLNYVISEELGMVPLTFNTSWCNDTMADAIIVYKLGSMSGLSTLDITRLELVDGTEDINVPFGSIIGAGSATWSGEWILEADFVRFNADTTATLQNTFCNFTFESALTGRSIIRKPSLAARVYLAGSTDNLIQFQESSSLNEAVVKEMTFGYEKMVPQIGIFEGMVTLDADEPLLEIGQSTAEGGLTAEFQTLIQDGIDMNLPYQL